MNLFWLWLLVPLLTYSMAGVIVTCYLAPKGLLKTGDKEEEIVTEAVAV